MEKNVWLHRGLFGAFLVLAVVVYAVNPFSDLNYFLQDFLNQLHYNTAVDIVSIAVKDKNGPRTYEDWKHWSRSQVAELLEALNADPENSPAVIGLDMPLYSRGNVETDKDLARAINNADNVVLATQIQYNQQLMRDMDGRYFLDRVDGGALLFPMAPISQDREIGFTNLTLDHDGRLRRCLLRTVYDGNETKQFSVQVYETYLKRMGAEPAKLPKPDRQGMWYVGFTGAAGEYTRGMALNEQLLQRIASGRFRNAIVMIGAYPPGLPDGVRTSYSRGKPVYLSEVQADMVRALRDGRFIKPVPGWIQALMLVLALAVCRMTYWRSIVSAGVTFAACTVGYYGIVIVSFLFGWLLDPLYVPLFALLFYLFRIASDTVLDFADRVRTRNTLRRYLTPKNANRLLLERISLERPVKREIAVLFVDIRGFTPLSESLAPEQLAEVLEEYLTLTSSAIFHNGGTVDKFIGDATMGFFNAPLDQEDYIYRAVKAAMEITAGAQRLKEKFRERLDRSINFGVGVHFGEAVVGNIGSTFRRDYTAVGDTVNTAARLESAAAPGQVLISLRVCEALEGRLRASFVGEREIKGKSKPMLLYRVDSLDGIAPDGSAVEMPESLPESETEEDDFGAMGIDGNPINPEDFLV